MAEFICGNSCRMCTLGFLQSLDPVDNETGLLTSCGLVRVDGFGIYEKFLKGVYDLKFEQNLIPIFLLIASVFCN